MSDTARTGQTLLIVASTMLFAAFTSAMIVRRETGGDWQAPLLPAWFWITAIAVPAASWLAESGWVRSAMAAGALLLVAQAGVFVQLRASKIGDAFCAVLIAAHALHVAGGLAALGLWGKRAALFWHFAGALWVYVLLLLGVWA